MKIYYNKNNDELLTEEEMNARVEKILNLDVFIQELTTYDYEDIWYMLTEEAKNDIVDDCKNYIINEDFITRDF